jgi:HEPN domain-containing protein
MLPRELRREHAELLLVKAAEDEIALDLMLSSPEAPDTILGYHLQQAAEKLLKAVMAAHGIAYEWTHNLDELVADLRHHGVGVPADLGEVTGFIPFAIRYRYERWPAVPGTLDRAAARELLRKLRTWAEGQVELAVGKDP